MFFITLLIHFLIYVLYQFDKKKNMVATMLDNATGIMDKLDSIKEYNGGNKMDETEKKAVKYLGAKLDKISDALESIDERLEDLQEQLSENEPIDETEINDTVEESEFDDAFEEDEPEDEVPKPPKEHKVPESFDITKRQLTTEKEEPKKKKGFFRKGK